MMKFLASLFTMFALLLSAGSITFAQGWLATGELGDAEQIHSLIEGQEGVLLAATNAGLFRSTDNGDFWEEVYGGNFGSLLAASDGTLYAGQHYSGYVLKSLDNGLSWMQTNQLTDALSIECLAEGPDGTIYAGSYLSTNNANSQVFRTTDSGETWIPASLTPGVTRYDEYIQALAVTSNGMLFVAVSSPGRIYSSTDYGDTWILHLDEGWYEGVYELIATQGDDLYAGTSNDETPVFKSTDSGYSWYPTAQFGYDDGIFSLAMTSQGVLFAGGGYWGEVFYTQDDGDSWLSTGDFHHAGNVQALLATSENEVFAGTYLTGQVFRFTDGCEIDNQAYPKGATHPGTTCMVCDPSQNINRWSYNPEGDCMAWLPTGEMDGVEEIHMLREFSDHAIWAATGPHGQVFRSEDDGETWLTTPYLSASEDVNCLLEASDGTIYAGTAPYGNVFKTVDYGEVWLGTGALGGVDSVNAMVEDTNGEIYAIGDGPLYRTSNGGQTWDLVRSRTYGNDLLISSTGTFFLCNDDAVCMAPDPSRCWSCEHIDYASDLYNLFETDEEIFYTAGRGYNYEYDGVVFRSLNRGEDWEPVGDFTYTGNTYSVNSLLEVSGGKIFAGTSYDGGVYINEPGTDSWIITHDLEEAENVRALFQAGDKTIWAGTSPHGDVFKSCNGCAIDGDCWMHGDENPESACEICDVALHTARWSHNGNGCYIDGQCYTDGQVNGEHQCLYCDSANSPLAWSAYTGQCFIEEQCWSDSQINPDDTCEYCDSDQAIWQWTFDGSGCYIDGQCYAHRDTNPENICEICNSLLFWNTWTANDGVECDDGRFCTVEDTCMDFDCDGVPRDCADAVSCTIDSCNEDADTCDHLEDHTTCSDGQWCDGEEICDAGLGCIEGAPVECDDGFFCSGVESCDEEQDICVATGNPCEEDQECFEKTDECRTAVEVCWEELGELEGADNIRAILENGEGTLFVGSGSNPGRLHRSADAGQTWTELSFPETPDLFVDSLAIGPGGYLYAGADGHVHRSPDNGESWEELVAFHNSSGIVSFLNASNGFHAVTGDPLGRVYRTVNEGQTWGIVFENELGHSRGMIQHADLSFSVLSYPNQVFRSPTGEPPWSSTEVEGAKRLLRFIETSYGSMVGVGSVVAAKYFYRTMDHWQTWSRVELDGLISSMNDIIEADDGTLYIAGMKYEGGNCVIRSTDHGLTWRRTQNLGDTHSVFVLYRTVGGKIYAGTGNEGKIFQLSFDCPGDDDDDDTGDDDTGDDDTGDDDTGDDDTGDDDTGDDDTGDDDTGDDDTGDDDTGDDDTGDDDTGDDDTGDDDTGDDDTGDDDTGGDGTGDDDTGDDESDKNDDDEGGCW